MAQWVKRWPTDLAVPSSIPTRGEISSTVNGVANSLSLSTSHRPDTTEILLKRSSIHRLRQTRFPPLAGIELGRLALYPLRYGAHKLAKNHLQKAQRGNDHEDAGEVKMLKEEMALNTCIRAV